MKCSILIACLLFVFPKVFSQVFNYEVGDVVRNHIIIDTDGVEYELHDITANGQYIYIDFFFVDCFPCQQTAPIFNQFYDTYGCNEGSLFMVAMSGGLDDDDNAVIAFEDEFGGEYNHAPAISFDGGGSLVADDFGIGTYPTFCLIGPDNTLLVSEIWPIVDLSTFEATIPTDANAVVMECSLGLDDSEVFGFSLYPNPTSGNNVNIELGANVNKATVTIYNVLGLVMYSQVHFTNQIAINTNMASGSYIISVKTEQGTLNKSLVVK